jgi:transposase
MRFVPVKSVEQQTWSAIHRLRQGYTKDRTAAINRIRSLLAEFGHIFPKSPGPLYRGLPAVLDDASGNLGSLGREAIRRLYEQVVSLDRQIAWCDEQIQDHARSDPRVRVAMTQFGIGLFTASAVVAELGALSQFKSGRQFSAWLGLVPRQYSTGGKVRLGPITKRGNSYLRSLFVMGARSALRVAAQKDDEVSRWACALRERADWRRACVALASKNARHVWALLSKTQAAVPPSGAGLLERGPHDTCMLVQYEVSGDQAAPPGAAPARERAGAARGGRAAHRGRGSQQLQAADGRRPAVERGG